MKQCKKCGELLPLANFREKTGDKGKKYIFGICRACELVYEKERKLKNKLEIKPMEKVRFERKFKEIEPERILDVSKYGIQLRGTDEIFVKLMDYRDAYISNYGRCINICYNGRCNLLKGQKRDGKLSYTVRKTVFVDGISEERHYHLYAARAVVDNFIINPDQEHNTYIWHSNYNKDDYYYKNLYPVNQNQFYAICKVWKENGYETEEDIMNIINDFRFVPDDYREKDFVPTVCGIGYIGCLDCDASSHSYRTWKNMLYRYYNSVCLERNPQYKWHSVCEEWHNYANFRYWYKTHFYRCGSERMELDHNILIRGNTVYSPSAAVFVPHYINNLITYEKADNSGLPIGVTYRKETNRFRATCSVKNKKKEIGNYKTAEEAGKAYAEYKEKLIKETAERYKDCISYNVYDSLMNWKV